MGSSLESNGSVSNVEVSVVRFAATMDWFLSPQKASDLLEIPTWSDDFINPTEKGEARTDYSLVFEKIRRETSTQVQGDKVVILVTDGSFLLENGNADETEQREMEEAVETLHKQGWDILVALTCDLNQSGKEFSSFQTWDNLQLNQYVTILAKKDEEKHIFFDLPPQEIVNLVFTLISDKHPFLGQILSPDDRRGWLGAGSIKEMSIPGDAAFVGIRVVPFEDTTEPNAYYLYQPSPSPIGTPLNRGRLPNLWEWTNPPGTYLVPTKDCQDRTWKLQNLSEYPAFYFFAVHPPHYDGVLDLLDDNGKSLSSPLIVFGDKNARIGIQAEFLSPDEKFGECYDAQLVFSAETHIMPFRDNVIKLEDELLPLDWSQDVTFYLYISRRDRNLPRVLLTSKTLSVDFQPMLNPSQINLRWTCTQREKDCKDVEKDNTQDTLELTMNFEYKGELGHPDIYAERDGPKPQNCPNNLNSVDFLNSNAVIGKWEPVCTDTFCLTLTPPTTATNLYFSLLHNCGYHFSIEWPDKPTWPRYVCQFPQNFNPENDLKSGKVPLESLECQVR